MIQDTPYVLEVSLCPVCIGQQDGSMQELPRKPTHLILLTLRRRDCSDTRSLCSYVDEERPVEKMCRRVSSPSSAPHSAMCLPSIGSHSTISISFHLLQGSACRLRCLVFKRLTVLREGSKITAKVSKLVLDAEHVGVVSGREARCMSRSSSSRDLPCLLWMFRNHVCMKLPWLSLPDILTV